MTFAGALLISGFATLFFGATKLDEKETTSPIAWTSVGVGSMLMLAPFFGAGKAAFGGHN